MRALIPLTFLVSFCTASWANESCALRAAQLLSIGKSAELATWFKSPSADIAAEIQEVVQHLGSLERITPALSQRTGKTTRTSILSNSLPSQYSFDGSWADAVSTKVGPLQIQASSDVGSICRLFAMHIDIQS